MWDLVGVWLLTVFFSILLGYWLLPIGPKSTSSKVSKAKQDQRPKAFTAVSEEDEQVDGAQPREARWGTSTDEDESLVSKDEGAGNLHQEAQLSDSETQATQEWKSDTRSRDAMLRDFIDAAKAAPAKVAQPSPQTQQDQLLFRDRSKALFTALRRCMDNENILTIDTSNPDVTVPANAVDIVNEIHDLLCIRLPKKFSSSRAAECTAMSLCCTVVMQEDALTLLQSTGEKYPLLKPACQQIIETVVPNIWSM